LTVLVRQRLNTAPTPVPANAADASIVTLATAAPNVTPFKNVALTTYPSRFTEQSS
jgi:hypothetical protein